MAARQPECGICMNSIKNPKVISCHHSFCYTCLEDYLRVNIRNGRFDCPICRTNVELPSECVPGFEANVYVNTDYAEKESHGMSHCAGGRSISPVKHCSPLLKEDIELHHAREPWKPKCLADRIDHGEVDIRNDDLYKKVRGILNKLTPQTFQKLVAEILSLKIDTETCLRNVIDIVYETAICDPRFSTAYANMCRCLSMFKVPAESKQGDVNFRALLLTRCQREFEKTISSEKEFDLKREEIDKSAMEKEKQQMIEKLDYEEKKVKKRSSGNIRFIGELFKLKMLTENIMHDCVYKLLLTKDEDNIECLCILLKTIGKELDSDRAKPRMDEHFAEMRKIFDNKKLSSKVRFMLLDVIELRQELCLMKEDRELHHAKEPWKPKCLAARIDHGKVDIRSDELYKKVRGILNKLTPQTFQKLVAEILSLKIDTETCLRNVTDIVYETAICDPRFSAACANMSRCLAKFKVPAESKKGNVNFQGLLLARCRREFEKTISSEKEFDSKRKEIEKSATEKEKQQMIEKLDYEEKKVKKRFSGNIRFTGELFKMKIVTENIMHDCVFKLLRTKDEDSIECLCILLQTIGKELDTDRSKRRMDQYFAQMQKIVNKKKLSSKVRFMLLDVIELRQSHGISHSARGMGGQGRIISPVKHSSPLMKENIELHHAKEPWKPKCLAARIDHGKVDIRSDELCLMKEDRELHHAKEPWKPKCLAARIDHGKVDIRSDELYKKVRGILNKLTPQTFQKLVAEILSLKIDTETCLRNVTDIVYETAICDPRFSAACANMSRCLAKFKVPAESKKGNVNFQGLLLARCRREFEKTISSEKEFDSKRKEIEKSATEKEKQQMIEKLDYEEKKVKKRFSGNIRFTGELFKMKIVTENIMHDCVFKLLRTKGEDSIECLCILLQTIGKELDTDRSKRRMDQYFAQMQKIVNKKKLSSKVRFMLLDVIELRQAHVISHSARGMGGQGRTISPVKHSSPLMKENIELHHAKEPWKPKCLAARIDHGKVDIRSDELCLMKEDIELHHAKEPWKPKCLAARIDHGEVNIRSDELYKKVRGILNKLTPQTFQKLVAKMQSLKIDTETCLKNVIDIVFETAICDPRFSAACANMCRCLAMFKVPAESKKGHVNFRALLLTRCQHEFANTNSSEKELDSKRKKSKKIEKSAMCLRQTLGVKFLIIVALLEYLLHCLDLFFKEKEKQQMIEKLDYEEKKVKKRSSGNIRFIGELFKIKMLTENIMHDCVFKLLRSKDEEKLECLCILLQTIGKELDSDKAKRRMDQYFVQMQTMVNKKKLSSKVRFMLLDVIELRQVKWVPRRDDNKTIDQIHQEEAQKEQDRAMFVQTLLQAKPQKGSHGSSARQPSGSMDDEADGADGSNIVSRASLGTDQSIDPTKLNNLGLKDRPAQLHWFKGSTGGGTRSQEEERPNTPDNRFSVLNKTDRYEANGSHRGGRWRRSGPPVNLSSQKSEREKAITAAKTVSAQRLSEAVSGGTESECIKTMEKPSTPIQEVIDDQIGSKARAIMDDYLQVQDVGEAISCVQELSSSGSLHLFVYNALNQVLKRSEVARRQTGQLLHDLVKNNVLLVDTYVKGLNQIMMYAEDMEIDIPQIWEYLGQLIGPMVQDGSVPLGFLKQVCEPLTASSKSGILIAEILHDASNREGHQKVARLWAESGLHWSDFVPEKQIDQFLAEKKLEFTKVGNSAPKSLTASMAIPKIEERLNDLITNKGCSNEEVFDWIEEEVDELTIKQEYFIRALMTAVCKSAVIDGSDNLMKVDISQIQRRSNLLQKYLDHQVNFELQALYALQALVHKLEHPPGVLQKLFDILYDEDIISEDTFIQWEKSEDPCEQEGKSLAMKQVVQFFKWLKEAEDDVEI